MTLIRFGIAGSSLCLIGLALAVEGKKESAASRVCETRGLMELASSNTSEERPAPFVLPCVETPTPASMIGWLGKKVIPTNYYDLINVRYVEPSGVICVRGPSDCDEPSALVFNVPDLSWLRGQSALEPNGQATVRICAPEETSTQAEQFAQLQSPQERLQQQNAEPRVDLLEPEPLDPGWQRDVTVVLRPLGYEEGNQQPPPTEPMPIAPSQVQPASVAPVPVCPPVQPMPTWKTAPARKPAKAESFPLTGTHPCTLDDQNSLALPRRVQEQLGETRVRTVFVTAGPDACLWIYSPAGLEHLANQLEQKPGSKTQAQVFQRLYFAHTEPVPVDRHGWINIPEHLARFAGLGHDVVLIGVRDHFELWDAQRWQQYLEQNAPETRSNRKGRAAHAGKAELEE